MKLKYLINIYQKMLNQYTFNIFNTYNIERSLSPKSLLEGAKGQKSPTVEPSSPVVKISSY